jgi:hypothetical protein
MISSPATGRAVHRLSRSTLLMAVVLLVAACSDPYGPRTWNPEPTTLTLYSASRPEYTGLVSAMDLAPEPVFAVSIEAPGATGSWDFVLAEQGNALTLVPAGTFTGVPSRARIAVLEGVSMDDVVQAPRDTAAYTAAPVPLRTDVVYVLRSRRASCGLTTGHRYARPETDPGRSGYRSHPAWREGSGGVRGGRGSPAVAR